MEYIKTLRSDIMIRGYFGLPGSGKTYAMTRDAINECKGRVVYTNYDVDIPDAAEIIKLKRPHELVNVRNGLCLIDEAGLWLPSFIWKRIPEQLIWQLAQVRKNGIDLFYTAQNPARVVKVLREITFESIHSEKFFKIFIQHIYTGINDKKMCTRILFFSRKVANRYDTYQKVGVLS
jgi:hypothetical protein